MASEPVTIRLRCASWKQLSAIYRRDLTRSALFLKASKPPPVGTQIRINLTLPSETLIILSGTVAEKVPPGGLEGRGPGIDIQLHAIPQSAMWVIESALTSARSQTSSSQPIPRSTTERARRQASAPPTEPPPSADASIDAGSDIVHAEEDLVDALATEYRSLERLNPFQILGIGYETSDAEVRAAFGELTKRYHPDRFARYQSVEAREYASEIFILIRDAYRKLHDARGRARVLDVMRNRRPPSSPQRRPTPTSGDPRRRRDAVRSPGLRHSELFRDQPPAEPPERERPPDAITPGSGALPPAGPERAAALLEHGRYDEAVGIYSLALRRNPDDHDARAGIELAEGLRALEQRDRLEAAQRFEAVLEFDPTNERAARELAEMRRRATNERKGLLTRLLGKKD